MRTSTSPLVHVAGEVVAGVTPPAKPQLSRIIWAADTLKKVPQPCSSRPVVKDFFLLILLFDCHVRLALRSSQLISGLLWKASGLPPR